MSADKKVIGARLRAAREAPPYWSRAEMARRLRAAADLRELPDLPHVPSLADMIKQWEKGKYCPDERYRRLYAKVLDTDEETLFGPRQGAMDAAGTTAYLPHQGPVAPELVMYFLEQLPGHYRADMWLGPRHLIPTVVTQAQLIEELSRAADSPVRHGLLGAGVAYSCLLGWLYQDAGDIERAGYWRAAALDMAHRSGDPQLISYSLTNKAMLAIDLGDGRAVIDYATAAMADEYRLCPKVRVLALVHQAHGYAMLPGGDRATVERLLDQAAGLVDLVDDEHPWGNACRRTPSYIDVQRATAYVRLGAYRDAVSLWERILGTAPESARRDNGVFWARQAGALAAVPEPERVVEIAAATAPIVEGTGSARLRRELKTLPSRAGQWRSSAPGRELVEIISGIN